MIDHLFSDTGIRAAMQHLRPEEDSDALARVAWSVLAEPGDGVAGVLIDQFGAADALRIALTPEAAMSGLETMDETTAHTERALREGRKRWMPRADAGSVHDALRGAAEVSAQLVLPGDPQWPLALDDLGEHAPLLLWARGHTRHLAAQESVAIVGARAATSYGDHVAAELAGDLAAGGTLVVSGGAYGIDGTAHRAALASGVPPSHSWRAASIVPTRAGISSCSDASPTPAPSSARCRAAQRRRSGDSSRAIDSSPRWAMPPWWLRRAGEAAH